MAGNQFQNPVLDGMRRVFGFKQGFNISKLADDQDPIPVLEIGQFSRLGGGLGNAQGFWMMNHNLASGIAGGSVTDTQDVLANALTNVLANTPSATLDWLAWYYGGWCNMEQTTPGEFSAASMALDHTAASILQGTDVTIANANQILFHGTTTLGTPIDMNGGDPVLPIAAVVPSRLPVPLYSPGRLKFGLDRAGGALGTVTLHWGALIWIGRIGSLPPGL